MPVTASTLRKLASLNLSPEQMSGVLELLAEQQEAEERGMAEQRLPSSAALRQRRYRERKAFEAADKQGSGNFPSERVGGLS